MQHERAQEEQQSHVQAIEDHHKNFVKKIESSNRHLLPPTQLVEVRR